MVLESRRLPAPDQMASFYQSLMNLSPNDLTRRYALLQQAARSSAVRTGKIGTSGSDDRGSYANTPREQMAEEITLEYLKAALGKPTLSGKTSSLLTPSKP